MANYEANPPKKMQLFFWISTMWQKLKRCSNDILAWANTGDPPECNLSCNKDCDCSRRHNRMSSTKHKMHETKTRLIPTVWSLFHAELVQFNEDMKSDETAAAMEDAEGHCRERM